MTGGPVDFSWAAGFVDGEGYLCVTKKAPWIGVRRSGKRAGSVRREGVTYWMILVVVNRNPAPLQKLVALFGGHLKYKTRHQGKQGYWHWRVNSQTALAAVETMLPFLVGKAELAAHCISFQRWYNDTMGENGRSMTAERRNRAEFYYLECRRLLRLFNAYSAVGKKHDQPALAEVIQLQTGTARG